MEYMKLKYTGKKQRYQHTGVLTSLKGIRENAISVDLHRSKRISSNFDAEVQIIKSKFKSVGLPFAVYR